MRSKSPLAQRYEEVQSRLADACARSRRQVSEVTLVAVTKTASDPQIVEAASLGMRHFGESRVQVFAEHVTALETSLRAKPEVAREIRWHMIGHLQRNKVKQILPFTSLIHSVDSLRLAEELEAVAAKTGRKVPVLMQVNAGEEPQKHGVAVGAALAMAEQIAAIPGLELCGLMSMAPLTEDADVVRAAFSRTRELFEEMKWQKIGGSSFRHLSMGMSHDFEIAVEEGATLIRVGSSLFGDAKKDDSAE